MIEKCPLCNLEGEWLKGEEGEVLLSNGQSHYVNDVDCRNSQFAQCQEENQRLREVVEKLPKCWRLVEGELVQDVPIVPLMEIYRCYKGGEITKVDIDSMDEYGIYSQREDYEDREYYPFSRCEQTDGKYLFASIEAAASKPEKEKENANK